MDIQEGVAVGRSFAMFKNYHIDGNKEMIAFGMMNIAGSCTSCYLTTGTDSMLYNKLRPNPTGLNHGSIGDWFGLIKLLHLILSPFVNTRSNE
jgi:hypothetical protein